jgi:uncharacterized membrane protein
MISLCIGIVFADENSEENSGENNDIQVDTVEETYQTQIIYAKARVVEVGEVTTETVDSIEDVTQEVTIEILEGELAEKELTTTYVLSYDNTGKNIGYKLKVGDTVSTKIEINSDGSSLVTIEGTRRSGYILAILLILIFSIILIGGKNGIKSVIGIAITFLVICFMLLKMIFNGINVFFSTLLTSIVIILVTSILNSGINKKTFSAAIGAFGGILLSGIVTMIFSRLSELTGASEDAIQLSMSLQKITFKLKDLLFASVLISSLGACTDIAIKIANNLEEQKKKTEDASLEKLFKQGLTQGKNLIGTKTNNLLLAYAGEAIKIVLLFMACQVSFMGIINKEIITEDIILAVSGTLGMIYTIPITSVTYAIFNRKKTIYKTTSENLIEGKRSLKM